MTSSLNVALLVFAISNGEKEMKKYTSICLLGLALSMSVPVFAENRAVNINIGSTGGALDDAALHAVRKIIGKAIISSTVDTFIVYSPKVGGPIPREGGLSACAEAGFSSTPISFNSFNKQLHSIHPKTGTFLNLELVANCKPNGPVSEPVSCGGITGKQCPSDQACIDDPSDNCDPKHGGADCSGICVAKPNEPVSCGGITGKPCPGGQACIDDPNDNCDPKHGGSDCSGICVAKHK
jgi:hypothetical protein